MRLFKKKEEKKVDIPKLPELPRLPELPELPDSEKDSDELISQLPSFPSNSLGDKFSQYNIKEAINGREETIEEKDAGEDEESIMQKPLVRKESKSEDYSRFERVKETEPLFIRIDKFEEGSKNFEEVKKQILGIEKMFNDLKSVKEDEEKELKSFEEEIRKIKERVEKIDDNVFSKIG
jgi:hypothetical protein